eukprot:gene14429-30711_t
MEYPSVIDISTIEYNDPHSSKYFLIANQFLDALSTWGFIYITGYEIPQEILTNSYRSADIFFSQSRDDKILCKSKDTAKRGYSEYESDNFACLIGEIKPNDLVEKFRIGPISQTNNLDYFQTKDARKYFYPNSWMGAASDLTPAIPTLYEHMISLSRKLLHILEISLSLPHGFFVSKIEKSTSILTLNNYPHIDHHIISKQGQMRVAEHTDVSMLTIVAQSPCQTLDGSGGLEIQAVDGHWVRIPYQPNTLVVNIGDCLSDWTQGILKSTRHRVSLPSITPNNDTGVTDNNRRMSLAFFLSPDYDARMNWPHSTEKIEVPCETLPYTENKCTDPASGTDSYKTDITTYAQWRKRHIKRAMTHLPKAPII